MNEHYIAANWDIPVLAGTTRTTHPHANEGFNLARHIACDRMIVEANRQAWLASLALEGVTPMWLVQTHSNTVVDSDNYQYGIEADAVISRDPKYMAVVLTADCVPILLTNRDGSEVAAIHAGWQGLYRGVVAEAINRMHSRATDLCAWIGPCIQQQHYEVDDAFRTRFLMLNAQYENYFSESRVGHWYANLPQIAHDQLCHLGIVSQCIYHSGICTFADEGYFSYRRDGSLSGRVASFIRPKPNNIKEY